MIDMITMRLFFYRSQVCILVKTVLSEGMGSRIPIKIAGKSKATKRVLSYSGETCSEKVEKPFIIKADYLKGMVIAKRKRFI